MTTVFLVMWKGSGSVCEKILCCLPAWVCGKEEIKGFIKAFLEMNQLFYYEVRLGGTKAESFFSFAD